MTFQRRSFEHEAPLEDFLWYPINPFTPKISLVLDSPYCLPNNSCDVILENLVLDQLMIPKLIFVSILITCLLDVVS